MKNLLLLILFFVTTICSAQLSLQVNQEGEYRAKPELEITAHPKALKYNLKFPEAILSPGEKILGERVEKFTKLKPWFKKQVEIREYFITYNSQTKYIDYIEAGLIKNEKPCYLILLSITSILLMIISNVLFKKGRKNFAIAVFTVAFVAAILTLMIFATDFAFVIAFATDFTIFVATFAAAFAALIASIAIFVDKEGYKWASIAFCVLMIIHIVLLFI